MARVQVPKHVVLRSFGDETVLLNLETGTYHGLNATGGRMLEVLAEVADTDEVARVIAHEYGQPEKEVAEDLDQLCQALVARGLIVTEDANGTPAA